MTKPIPKKSGVIHAARTKPGPSSQRRQPVRGGAGGAWRRVLDDLGHGAVTLSLASLQLSLLL